MIVLRNIILIKFLLYTCSNVCMSRWPIQFHACSTNFMGSHSSVAHQMRYVELFVFFVFRLWTVSPTRNTHVLWPSSMTSFILAQLHGQIETRLVVWSVFLHTCTFTTLVCLGDDDVTTIHHHSHVNCVTCALPGGVTLGCIWSRVWCVEASIADHCGSFWRGGSFPWQSWSRQ